MVLCTMRDADIGIFGFQYSPEVLYMPCTLDHQNKSNGGYLGQQQNVDHYSHYSRHHHTGEERKWRPSISRLHA